MCVCLCTHMCVHMTCIFVCLCIFMLSECVCISQTKHTRQSSWCVDTVASSTSVLRLMAFFPGSSHLPTLLLFVAFQSWEKQRQLVGSTANPQGQAVFLQKRMEYTHSTRSRPEGAIQATSQDLARQVTPKYPRIKSELKDYSCPLWNLRGFREGTWSTDHR